MSKLQDNIVSIDGDLTELEGNLLIWVHWSADDKLSEADRFAIESYLLFFDSVLIVSNSNKYKSNDLKSFQSQKVVVVTRRNVGHDFGAYKDAVNLAIEYIPNLKSLTLVNNSVYLLQDSIGELNDRLSKFDVASATDSYEFKWHLQSYWLRFSLKAIKSDTFAEYWENLEIPKIRLDTVHKCEIPLAGKFLQSGLTVGSAFEYSKMARLSLSPDGLSIVRIPSLHLNGRGDMDEGAMSHELMLKKLIGVETSGTLEVLSRASKGIPMNPVYVFWDLLIAIGCPFIKKDLIFPAEDRPSLTTDRDWNYRVGISKKIFDQISGDGDSWSQKARAR